jgi:hypothetical protein
MTDEMTVVFYTQGQPPLYEDKKSSDSLKRSINRT